jgi:Ran GTPase-activating protein (RanGAP) involved in mRNA processing and transport
MSPDWASWSERFRWRVSRRGNVVELWADPVSLITHASQLEREPVSALSIESADTAGIATLSLRAPFRNLRELSVDALGVSGALVATLVERLHSPRLRSLTLSRVQLDGTGPAWRKVMKEAVELERLELSNCFSSGEAAAAFLCVAKVPSLQRLRLPENSLKRGVEALARQLKRAHRELHELGLGANGLDGRAVCKLLDGLRPVELWLTLNPLGAEGMRRVAREVDASALRQLGIAQCQLGEAGARAMTLWLGASSLEHIFADGNGFDAASANHFATHWRRNLSGSLLLADNQLGDSGVAALVSTSMGERLRRLDLSSNGLSGQSLRSLAQSSHLRQLRELELSDNDLGDEGAIALCESSLLGRLVDLDLSSNRITRVGARALAERAGKRLRSFWLLRGNEVPAMFVQTMRSHGVGVV